MLNKFQIQVQREEVERVDTLRYSWQKLLTLAVSSTISILCVFIVQSIESSPRSPHYNSIRVQREIVG